MFKINLKRLMSYSAKCVHDKIHKLIYKMVLQSFLEMNVIPLSFQIKWLSLQEYYYNSQVVFDAISAYVLGGFSLLLILSICT